VTVVTTVRPAGAGGVDFAGDRPYAPTPMAMPSGAHRAVGIRAETADDLAAIRRVNVAAFGRENEARLVQTLRSSPGFIRDLSLVAADADHVVGHILFSSIRILSGVSPIAALALAPMAVLPGLQSRGLGSRLVRAGLGECRRLGHRIVIVVGHPAYYPRFGFSPARACGLEAPFPVPDPAFLALELVPGALAAARGLVEYPPAFSEV